MPSTFARWLLHIYIIGKSECTHKRAFVVSIISMRLQCIPNSTVFHDVLYVID